MIKHIVFFKVPEEKNKKDILEHLDLMLKALPGKIQEIKFFETGKNISTSKAAYDFVLISEFEGLATLDKYRVHPEHKKVLDFISQNELMLKVVDYEF